MHDRERVSPTYWPLYNYLAAQTSDRVTLRLTDLEAIIGASLPPRAHGRQWWVNAHASLQGRAWLKAGWRAARTVTTKAGTVTTNVLMQVLTALMKGQLGLP